MRLATLRTAAGTTAARIEGDTAVPVDATDVVALLAGADWRSRASDDAGEPVPLAEASLAPVVVRPSKVFCVGLNYRGHILETGRELPDHPTLFAKFASTLLGPYDDLVLPAVSDKVDWEVELGVVIGAPARRLSSDADARAAIAGFCVVNDVSMRDWQYRTLQWLQGKCFEATTPAGPWLVTPDEVDFARDLEVRCEVDGEVMQLDRTADLLFDPVTIVRYISQITTLEPGDLIATGTPAGIGGARDPQVFLRDGQVVVTAVEGIGACRNRCCAER